MAEYKKPSGAFIPRGDATRKLYALEEQRNDLIRKCAEEWSRLCKAPKSAFWTEAMPQALFDILDSFEVGAAYAAAEAFIERHPELANRPCSAQQHSGTERHPVHCVLKQGHPGDHRFPRKEVVR